MTEAQQNTDQSQPDQTAATGAGADQQALDAPAPDNQPPQPETAAQEADVAAEDESEKETLPLRFNADELAALAKSLSAELQAEMKVMAQYLDQEFGLIDERLAALEEKAGLEAPAPAEGDAPKTGLRARVEKVEGRLNTLDLKLKHMF